jgi:hypothetical protein
MSADCVISIGGGSGIRLREAISIRSGAPHICIPTTYSGSEMTPILGEMQNSHKTTRSDPKILPSVVINDIDFTLTLSILLPPSAGYYHCYLFDRHKTSTKSRQGQGANQNDRDDQYLYTHLN